MQNINVLGLFQIAYGEGLKLYGGWSHVRLITNDSSKFTDISGPGRLSHQYRSYWRTVAGHEYIYALKVPYADSATKYELMRKDLKTYFPWISAYMEKGKKKCLVLRRIGGTVVGSKEEGEPAIERTPYHLKINNRAFGDFVMMLKLAYQESDLQIVDETGYKGKFDFAFNGDVSDSEALNAELNKYGIELTAQYRDVDILVVVDECCRGKG